MNAENDASSTGDPDQRSTGRDARIDAIVEEFLELRRSGQPHSVKSFVERYPDLAPELNDVLPALEGLESLKEPPGASTPQEIPAPPRLGPYRLLRQLGRGGMGVVYEAEEEVLGRRVALKILPEQARLDPRLLSRFRREAQAAAQLHHTNIVPVFGFHEHEGICFYTMQKIDGRGLDRILQSRRRRRDLETGGFLGSPEATAAASKVEHAFPSGSASSTRAFLPPYARDVALLGVQVAEALDYAHERGVLHRDIKPSNLLVDRSGVVWVTDFGLAKTEGVNGLTQTGELVGTCRYMSPEAFEGRTDARSDVYGLGVTLYEAATLTPAFDETNRARLARKICERSPARPRKLEPRIPADLETVILKAIERRPEDRYRSAGALAADLRRVLAGVSPRARKTTALEHLWRWMRRNPAAAAAASTILALLILVAVISLAAWVQTRASLREAQLNTARLARTSGQPGRRWMALEAIAEAARIRPGLELRNEAIAAAHLVDLRPSGRRVPLGQSVHSARLDGDLERVAFVDQKAGAAVVRSVDDGRLLLRDDSFEGLDRVSFSADGSLLAAVGYGGLRVWDVDARVNVFERHEPINYATVSFGGRRTAGYCSGMTLVLVKLAGASDGAGGEPQVQRIDVSPFAPPTEETPRPFVSPDGSRVAVLFHKSLDVMLLGEQGEPTHRLTHPGKVYVASWHPTDPILLTAHFRAGGSRIVAWNALDGESLAAVEDPRFVNDRPAMRRDAGLILSSGWSDSFRVWDAWTGHQILSVPGKQLRLATGGDRLAVFVGAEVIYHDVLVPTMCYRLTREPADWVASALHPHLPLVATGYFGVALRDTRQGRELVRLPTKRIRFVQFLRDGTELVGVGDAGITTWPIRQAPVDASTQRLAVTVGQPRTVLARDLIYGCLSADGTVVFVTEGTVEQRWLRAVRLDSGQVISSWGPFPRGDRPSASPDGRWIAWGAWGSSVRTLRMIDLSGGVVRDLDFGANPAARFSPDSRTMLVGAEEGYSLVEVGSWKRIRHLPIVGGSQGVFSPDGRIVACRSRESRIILFEAATGKELATLAPPDGTRLSAPEFSADGALLSGGARLWDLRRLRRLLGELNLDWSQPAYPPPPASHRLELEVRVEPPN